MEAFFPRMKAPRHSWSRLLLVCALSIASAEGERRGGRFDDPDRFKAKKPDLSCKSYLDRWEEYLGGNITSALAPCRKDDSQGEEIDNEEDPVYEYAPECSNLPQSPSQSAYGPPISGFPARTSPPARPGILCPYRNSIHFYVYIAVPRNEASIGHLVKLVVTFFLNATITEYSYKLREWQERNYRNSPIGQLFSMVSDLVNQIISGRGDRVTVINYLVDADPKPILKEAHLTWWRYRVLYHSFYAQNDKPVLDGPTLIQVRRTSIQTLQSGVDLLFETLKKEVGDEYPILKVQLKSPLDEIRTPPPTPVPPKEPFAVPERHEPPSPEPAIPTKDDTTTSVADDKRLKKTERVDTKVWDMRRYVGLGILLGTIWGTLCLMQIAACRRQQRTKKQVWSNLSTVEGVEELLRTGWKIQGSSMEVFDKKNVGYEDDSSMFKGGYEQREVVGAEITVTHEPSSEMSPDSGRSWPV